MPKPDFKHVEQLFHQAVAVPLAERPAFLDGACGGDAELRRAVEELLRHDAAGDEDRFLAHPITRPAGALSVGVATRPDWPAGVFPTGSPAPSIPGYEILEELGRGGMGIVYKARQSKLNRLVAIKLIPAAPAVTIEQLARFHTEAEALARLQHPNIVQIFDVGTAADSPYIVMEYVDGPSLARLLDHRPQDVMPAAQLIETAARAMDAVHRCGIVHRDLKPANILLSGIGSQLSAIGQTELKPASFGPIADSRWPMAVKITDFGLAKNLQGGAKLTQTGVTMGTPSYMAPEQASPREEIGPAADIYALGAILYEMLTGRPPFQGATAVETIAQVVQDEPLSPRYLQPRLPLDITTICLKCLEKSPRARYASALDLAEDLRRFQAGEPIHARPVRLPGRTWRWCRRRPLVAGSFAVSLLLATALVVTVLVYDARLQAALARAEQTAEQERRQIVQLNINIGCSHLEEGDALAALLRFAEALRLDQGTAEQERDHRARIAATLRHGPRLRHFLVPDGRVLCAEPAHDGGRVATVTDDRFVRVWNLATGLVASLPLSPDEHPLTGALSPDGQRLVTAAATGRCKVWDLKTQEAKSIAAATDNPIAQVRFHANSRILIVQHGDARVRIWDTSTGEPVALPVPAHAVGSFVTVSEDGRWLLTIDAEQVGQLWEVAKAKPAGAPMKQDDPVARAAISRDGRRVAMVDTGHTLRVWETASGQQVAAPVELRTGVADIVVSRDAERVAAVGRDGTVQVREAGRGQGTSLPTRSAKEARFSPDGRLLATRDADQRIRVWDLQARPPAVLVVRHGGPIRWTGFSEDGTQLVIIGDRGTGSLWDLPPVQRWPEMRSVVAGADIDPDERSVDDIVALAQLLAGSRIDERQVMVPLETERWHALGRQRRVDR